MIDLLLRGSRFSYVWHRLRFVLLQKAIQIGVRYLEWLSFRRLIGQESAFYYLLCRHVFEFVLRYRWSSLEDLRQELQVLVQAPSSPTLAHRIRQEWSQGFFASLGSAVFGIFAVMFTAYAGHASPIPVLVAFLAVRFVSDFFQRTLRSFIYASSRVYRPLWSMSGLDLLHGGLVYLLAKNYGVPGVLWASAVDGVLRMGVSWSLLISAYDRTGLPRLGRPRLRWARFRFDHSKIRAGYTLPVIEATFLVASMVAFNAFQEWDEFKEYTLWLYLISPLWFSAIGFYMVYYVDFLKFRALVFRRVRAILFLDSLRALAVFSIFSGLIAGALDRWVSDASLGSIVFFGVPALIFAWGFYGCSLTLAFVQGRRESLVLIALLTGSGVAYSWDYESLGFFLIGGPLIAGFLSILLQTWELPMKRQSMRCSSYAFRHWIEHAGRSKGVIQGLLLDRSILGFSMPLALARLEAALPPGSRYALIGRSHLFWWKPEGAVFTKPELFELFGSHWRCVETEVPEFPVDLQGEVRSWRLGQAVDPGTMGLDESDYRRLWGIMRGKIEGSAARSSVKGWRFDPHFERGVWTGGRFVRKT